MRYFAVAKHAILKDVFLIVASLFCFALLFGRVWLSGRYFFLFLVWNLFLAWIPWGVAQLHNMLDKPSIGLTILFVFLWLLFFPNAPYIITDFVHLRSRPNVPIWYDLMLILSFAYTGLMVGLSSLAYWHDYIRQKSGSGWAWLSISMFIWLSSFGVYVGRFLRWNSWDVFTHPIKLGNEFIALMINQGEALKAVGFILCFGAFIWIVYAAFINARGEDSLKFESLFRLSAWRAYK